MIQVSACLLCIPTAAPNTRRRTVVPRSGRQRWEVQGQALATHLGPFRQWSLIRNEANILASICPVHIVLKLGVGGL